MAFRLRGAILQYNLVPSVDSVVSELLVEEVRLKPQVGKCTLSTPYTFVLTIPSGSPSKPPSMPPSNNHNKPYSWVVMAECSYCKRKGHWKAQYPMIPLEHCNTSLLNSLSRVSLKLANNGFTGLHNTIP